MIKQPDEITEFNCDSSLLVSTRSQIELKIDILAKVIEFVLDCWNKIVVSMSRDCWLSALSSLMTSER